jgi:hypothetical protein
MAKEQNDFRATNDLEPYWTNQHLVECLLINWERNTHTIILVQDDMLRFLPRPADYLFLYFLGFYGLMLVLKIDPKAF